MAKPFVLAPPGPSNFPAQAFVPPTESTRHRSHPRPRSQAAPSLSILSLLATLASSSTVHGSPTPPSFLCPSLESGDIAECNVAKRAPTQVSRPPHTFDPRHTHAPRNVPDRFSKQADGAWRRVGSYTLYGSTMPACSSSCATPTAVISPLDDQIQVSDASDPATASTLVGAAIPTDLPPGWKPLEKHNRTALILLISLFLALFIGSLIVGSMLWRNRLKARRRARDVEAKKRRRHMDNEADVREILVEKEIKAKQKIWAKATARWRSNARFSARQRRGRRLSARLSTSNQSSASLDNSRTCLAEPPPSPQPGVSPRSSTSSLGDNHPSEDTPIPPSSSSSREDVSAPHESQARISPPAYHHHGQIPTLMLSPGDASSTELTPSTATGKERSIQHAHTPAYPALCDPSQSLIPMSLHAAHVATDDKAMLARLAELASAPPDEESGPDPQTSVPEWNDDDVEDVASHLLTPSPTQFPFSPMFPPPPSKERLAAAEQLYDYSYAFEEVAPLDLEAGPSAPPFEEGSSPPQERLIPSAPPLFDDSQHPGVGLSAPPLDPSSQSEGESEPGFTPREHHDHEPQPSDRMHASLAGPAPFAGASPIRDSVVLPGYQP